MPFNGSGVFQRVRNWVADATAGVKIRADYHDDEDNGFATGLTNCITKDGQTVVTQNIPFNSKRITGLADPVNPQDVSTKAYTDTKLAVTGGGVTASPIYLNGTNVLVTDGTNTLIRSEGATIFQRTSDGFTWGKVDINGLTMNYGGISTPGAISAGGSISTPAAISASGNITSSGSISAAGNVNGNSVTAQGGGIVDNGPLTVYGTTTLAAVTTGAISATTVNASSNIGTSASLFASANLYLGGGFISLNYSTNNRGLRLNGDDSVEMFGPANVKIKADGRVEIGRGILSKDGYSGGYGTVSYTLNWNAGAFYLKGDDTGLGYISVTSDYRTKKDVADLPGAWASVKALRPISYTQAAYGELFVADDIERWGFIAHELQNTLTQSAATSVKDDPDHIQSPNVWPVVAALTKALQEAMARIEALEGAP